MVFSKNKRTRNDCHIYIGDVEIVQVQATTFVGVYIDDQLNWRKQIQHVQINIAKSLSIMYKAKYLLDEATLLTIYSNLVLPYLTDCVETWGNTYFTNLKSIIILRTKL